MEDFRYRTILHRVIAEQIDQGKKIALKVSGVSMHPLIRGADSIHLEKCDPNSLSIGDIITFKNTNTYVTHRVVWISRKGNRITFVTKGDNEITPDRPVSPNHVVGKVTSIERGDRTLHLEAPHWRFVNRLLGMLFLMETISIQLYRFAARRFSPLRAFVLANPRPSLLYCRLKNRGLGFATRIIM